MSFKFNTPPGQTIDRKQYLCCGNSGTEAAPKWGKLGKRVEDSSAEMDWGEETKQDILGDTYTTMKKPVISQPFDPCELDSGDEYQQKIWNHAVVDQDAAALCNQDLLRGRERERLCRAVPQLYGQAQRPGRRGRRYADDAYRRHLRRYAGSRHRLRGGRWDHHLHACRQRGR